MAYATPGATRGEWDINAVYSPNDVVLHGGLLWTPNRTHSGLDPLKTPAPIPGVDAKGVVNMTGQGYKTHILSGPAILPAGTWYFCIIGDARNMTANGTPDSYYGSTSGWTTTFYNQTNPPGDGWPNSFGHAAGFRLLNGETTITGGIENGTVGASGTVHIYQKFVTSADTVFDRIAVACTSYTTVGDSTIGIATSPGTGPSSVAWYTLPEQPVENPWSVVGKMPSNSVLITGNYSARGGEVAFCDATAAPITVTLPAPYPNMLVTVKKNDASANAVTVAVPSPATIDGAPNSMLTTQYAAQTFFADNANWWVVA